jgi:hypothetical protein
MKSAHWSRRLAMVLGLLVGFFLVANAHAIPNRKEWQNLKKKYKIEQGLAKVNMGKAFDSFTQTFDKFQKKDPKKVLKALDKLKKDLASYTEAAKKKKVDGQFLAELEKIDKQIDQMRTIMENKADPLEGVRRQLGKEDFRLVGMALKELVAKEKDFKGVAEDFNKNANPVNDAVQKLAKEDDSKENLKRKAELLKDINTALSKLNAVIKKM